MKYSITKTYPHSLGLSAVFRQPKATSHCRDPHGYALEFELVFECHTLDDNNWVLDFGGLKPVKQYLVDTFDHRTLLAKDDPALADFMTVYEKYGFAPIIGVERVGCEGFAAMVADQVRRILAPTLLDQRGRDLRLASVTCREHSGNAATVHFDAMSEAHYRFLEANQT